MSDAVAPRPDDNEPTLVLRDGDEPTTVLPVHWTHPVRQAVQSAPPAETPALASPDLALPDLASPGSAEAPASVEAPAAAESPAVAESSAMAVRMLRQPERPRGGTANLLPPPGGGGGDLPAGTVNVKITTVAGVALTGGTAAITVDEPSAAFVIAGTWTTTYSAQVTDGTLTLAGVASTVHWTGVARSGTWNATVRAVRTGSNPISVTLNGTDGDELAISDTATATVTIAYASPTPGLTITAPAPNTQVPLPLPNGGTVTVSATTTPGHGPRTFTATGGLPAVSLPGGSGPVGLAPSAMGPHVISVTVTDTLTGAAQTKTVTVVGTDVTAPTVRVTYPAAGGQIAATPPGSQTCTFTLMGTSADDQSGMIDGQAQVTWATTPTGTPTVATPTGPATASGHRDFTSWSAPITVTGLGAHTIYVWAQDNSGNAIPAANPLVVPFQVVSGYAAATLAERLDGRAYLAALLEFANEQVTTPGGALVTAVVASALGQPVDRISQPLTREAEVSRRATNQLRVPVEVMRAYMAARGYTGTTGQAAYAAAAYTALLAAYGTTPAELQLARGMTDADRRALGTRLGIRLSGSRPDELDALLLTGSGITEAELEAKFGLPSTGPALDPLRDIAPATILQWRRTAQATAWAAQDAAPAATRTFGALLDPDVVTARDVAAGAAYGPITTALGVRANQLAAWEANLQISINTGATPTAALANLTQKGLPGVDLAALETAQGNGTDIGDQLAAAGLTQSGFSILRRLARLAALGPVTAAEWAQAKAILIGVRKQNLYPTWRAEESRLLPGATPVVVGPDQFVAADAPAAVSPYRVHPVARADWSTLLRTRTAQRQSLADGAADAVAQAEQAALPILRDGLVTDLAAAMRLTGDAAEQLTLLFQVDVKAAGTLRTTRLDQATESLQSLLFAIRSGQLPTGHPAKPWTLTQGQPAFDASWKWIGQYGSWQAATQTFLFPEQYRDPTLLLPAGNTPFSALWQVIRGSGQFRPADAIAQANAYVAASRTANPSFPSFAYPVGQRNRAAQNTLAALPLTADQAREALWAVPMLLAQQLQASGEYLAALDWYWLLYSYDLPQAGAGSILAAMNTELAAVNNLPNAPIKPDLTFPPGWLTRLDPYALGRTFPNLRATLLATVRCVLEYADSEFTRESDASVARARTLYVTAQQLLAHRALAALTPSNPGEAALALPVLGELTARAGIQLAKLRQGRNIAGLPRVQAATTVTGINQPTPYRFKVLLERARQLSGLAGQVEAQYLSALEKYDQKTLQLSDAQNALDAAGAQVAVHQAQVTEAGDAIDAAVAQKTKADTMSADYRTRIEAPPNQYEQQLLSAYPQMRDMKNVIAVADSVIGVANAASTAMNVPGEVFSFGAVAGLQTAVAAGYVVKGVATGFLNGMEAQMQANQLMAGIEDRRAEWRMQQASAEQDSLIAAAQVQVARDQQDIAQKELALASLQNSQALATLTLLTTQFTNADLYRWMSTTLGQVYRSLLQQATSVARLAQAQLAFERAENAQRLIGDSYWNAPGQTVDRGGLTGAERLTDDLSQLDQYAFTTDQRRMNLSQTFSLSALMPAEFLTFRRTGDLSFATPMALFDNDFPGHYLRLIRQVRVSVVGLIPPSRGIRATLASNGVSRVTAPTMGGFTDIALRREPSQVALTSPLNANGVFELDVQSEMLLPFEGSGVDTTWALQLPKAANPFDYDSLADVLFTVEYTALADYGYRAQVVERLNGDRQRSADCVFSLARDFPDQWWSLNNGARTVTITLRDNDFPLYIEQLATAAVGVQLLGADAETVTVRRATGGGDAVTTKGYASSRLANAPAWTGLVGTSPAGDWTITVPAGVALDDVLLILGWSGRGPAWT
ncbi:Tc toxin subunit A-related protein [Hamadaea tsunoensis]|uniref:Tc toxin subunit A-related protein n=1 Tax=Hamadaea tsunoensis TaxID=53368 RepID=UPI00042969F2|nr:neuraminidase-like domain-containing protein [Hamadaea tsunoensis]